MSYQLRIDEILEALLSANHPAAAVFQTTLEGMASTMAICLAQSQGIVAGVGSFEGLAFAGLCVPFYPGFDGQNLPDCMEGLDDIDEWQFDPDFVPSRGISYRPSSPAPVSDFGSHSATITAAQGYVSDPRQWNPPTPAQVAHLLTLSGIASELAGADVLAAYEEEG